MGPADPRARRCRSQLCRSPITREHWDRATRWKEHAKGLEQRAEAPGRRKLCRGPAAGSHWRLRTGHSRIPEAPDLCGWTPRIGLLGVACSQSRAPGTDRENAGWCLIPQAMGTDREAGPKRGEFREPADKVTDPRTSAPPDSRDQQQSTQSMAVRKHARERCFPLARRLRLLARMRQKTARGGEPGRCGAPFGRLPRASW